MKKLDEKKLDEILALRDRGEPYASISRRLKLPVSQVREVCQAESLRVHRRDKGQGLIEAIRKVYG